MNHFIRGTQGLLMMLVLCLTIDTAVAQPALQLPQPSQAATVSQTIGLTQITVNYARPVARGRTLWGSVVPYDQVWRTGANNNTTISFSTPVSIQGNELAAGTYGLHTIPTEDEWTVIFSNNSWSWGSFNYDPAEDALRVTAQPQSADFKETMQISFPDINASAATLAIHWGDVMVPVTIDVDVTETVFAQMRRDFDNLQGFNPARLAQGAAFAAQVNTNHEEAMTWVDRAIQAQPTFANTSVKALLLMQTGSTAEADALIAAGLDAATENEVNTFGYQLMGVGFMNKAGEMFTHNVEKFASSWNVHDSLGEYYANVGQTAEAIQLYEQALSMAPANQQPRINGILTGLRDSL